MSQKISISEHGKYIQLNNEPFLYLADTWWYGMTSRCKWPEPFKSLVRFRKKQGFNSIQMVVGVPPETDAFSKDTKNSGGRPFNEDFSLNKKYFDEVDLKIKYLITQGMVPVIFGGWGHHIDWMGEEVVKNLWREIIKRYSEYPVIYCLCGEVDGFLGMGSMYQVNTPLFQRLSIKGKIKKLLPNKVSGKLSAIKKIILSPVSIKDSKRLLKERLKKWDSVARYIKSLDRKTLLTVHPQSMVRASKLFGDPKWLDIDAAQSGHDKNRAAFLVGSALQKSKKPFINLEPWYEGIMGKIGDEDIRYAFWMNILGGAAGMGYGAHGVWQMSDGDNFMGHWGESNFRKSIKYKGAKQIGLAKEVLEEIRWWTLKPNLSLVNPHFNSITASTEPRLLKAGGEGEARLKLPTSNFERSGLSLEYRKPRTLSPWKLIKTRLPVVSENEENIVIYFPVGSGGEKFNLKGNFKEQKWIDPVSCEMILGKGQTESLIIPKVLRGQDAVCVIYKG